MPDAGEEKKFMSPPFFLLAILDVLYRYSVSWSSDVLALVCSISWTALSCLLKNSLSVQEDVYHL